MSSTQNRKQNHRPKIFKCYRCDFSAAWPARLKQHEEQVHSRKMRFACSYYPDCKFQTKYLKSVEEHQLRHDPVLSSRHKCKICSKGFCMPYELARHLRFHTQEKLNKCPECDFKAVNCTGLVSHRKKAHGIGKFGQRPQYSKYETAPSGCVKADFTEQGLEDGTTLYKCTFPSCDYETISKTCIFLHCRTVHNPYRIPCTVPGCSMKFKTEFALRNHMKTHEPHRQRNYECPMCSKKFLDSNGLTRHIKTHTDERPYKCPFCEYDSVENCNVYRHIRQQHPKNWTPGISVHLRRNSEANEMNGDGVNCKFCDFVAENPIKLVKHSVLHRMRGGRIRRLEHSSPFRTSKTDCNPMVFNAAKSGNGHYFDAKRIPVVILQRFAVKYMP